MSEPRLIITATDARLEGVDPEFAAELRERLVPLLERIRSRIFVGPDREPGTFIEAATCGAQVLAAFLRQNPGERIEVDRPAAGARV